MDDKTKIPDSLRSEAEARIDKEQMVLVNPQPGEELLHKLLHELQVHQVELQMQNDALRQAEIAMEESRDRYADLYDFAPIGYLTLSREGMINEINLTAADMLGVVRNKLIKRRFSQFVTETDRDRWYLHFGSVLKHDQRQRCELVFQREDGSHFNAQLDSLKVRNALGSEELEQAPGLHTPGGAFSVRIAITDITERVQAETAVTEAREFAESIVDTVREPLIVLDDALKVVSVSRSFYQKFHVAPEDTVGRQIYELGQHQWDIPKLREMLETILPHNRVLEDFEVVHDFPGIGKRRMLLNARRLVCKTGGTQLILLAMEDVTERG
ncbi:PAS domain-containing protein [Sideroxydans sp. CL21]|uniref:PAS domain-containing protein n=1 Tax=Sideroxydans sp. CL21 TaxID=2600596 RepID=UPI0024BCE6A8|nr:PAS domain-containing protein [Sideroxydans sp. CL21]